MDGFWGEKVELRVTPPTTVIVSRRVKHCTHSSSCSEALGSGADVYSLRAYFTFTTVGALNEQISPEKTDIWYLDRMEEDRTEHNKSVGSLMCAYDHLGSKAGVKLGFMRWRGIHLS